MGAQEVVVSEARQTRLVKRKVGEQHVEFRLERLRVGAWRAQCVCAAASCVVAVGCVALEWQHVRAAGCVCPSPVRDV